jgi:hypothetical protein
MTTSEAGSFKTEASRGGSDYWVVKLNGDGTKAWDKMVGGTNLDNLHDVIQTMDGGYLLIGDSPSPASGDKSENWKGLYGYGDYWIIKLDQSGAIVWQKTIGGGNDDYLRSMDQLADGSYILAGFGGGIAAYNKSERTRGGSDFWVVKLAAEAPRPIAFTPIRINSGGRSFTTSDGRLFRADSFYTGDNRISTTVEVEILNTTHDELYRTGRCSDNFGYNIPVPNGSYKVTLHFAETYWGVYPGRPAIASRRVFNVNAEGKNKLASYKILERAGGPLRAVQETFNVSVSDGFLNLDFLPGGADKPRVSAIEVEVIKPLTSLSLSPVADAYVRQFGK